MHAPWVVHTTAVGQRRRNYDVTIARHRTLRSHAWRITFTGGSRHALTTPQYLDKTDSADRRRYSCDVIKTLRATEATCSATSKAISAAIIRGHTRDGRLHATRHSWHLKQSLLKLCWCIFTLFMMSFLHTRLVRVLILLRSLFTCYSLIMTGDIWQLLTCYPQTIIKALVTSVDERK